jgi:hypothetical protein
MQIGGECIEYLLVNMVLAKKTSKRHKYEKTHFYASSLGNGLKKFQLEVSKVQQLEESKIVLPKPTLMNHHHH